MPICFNYFTFLLRNALPIGDGDNDADMLQMAGLGIAMENASLTAKKAASYLTYSNEEDGVAAVLNYLNWN